MNTDEIDRKVLFRLCEKIGCGPTARPGIRTRADLAYWTEYPPRTVSKSLQRLKKQGLVCSMFGRWASTRAGKAASEKQEES